MEAVSSSPVLISVVIPTHNEVGFIDKCLDSIFAADFPSGEMEVLVVDGMSDDGTRERLNVQAKKQLNLRVFNNPSRIVPTAMNIGIRAARGQFIIRLDAHSEYPANYFRMCLETIRRTGADNVGGIITTLPRRNNSGGKLVQALTTHRFGVGNAGFRIGAAEGWADTVPFGCFRRDLFKRIGWYDERLVRNQDYELNRRLRKHGGRIWLNPAIQLRYYNQDSLTGLLRQALITGQWNIWMWFVASHSFAWRHAVPLGFVGALSSTALSFLYSQTLGVWGLGLILLPYFIVACTASFQQARRYALWMLPSLPFLFFVYHVAYGLGGLRGLLFLLIGMAPVQRVTEPWPGAGNYYAMEIRREGS